MDSEDTISNHEMISTLKSELAALQFKRDRLISEVSSHYSNKYLKITTTRLSHSVAARHQRAASY